MNSIALHQLRMQRDAVHQKLDERDIVLKRKFTIDLRKRIRIDGTVVRWNLNPGQQRASARALYELDHSREILAQPRNRLTSQTVITAEFDHDDRRPMCLEQARQSRESAGRRIAGDTGIHNFITVSLLPDMVLEQRNPRLPGIESIAAAQGIADDHDGLARSPRGHALYGYYAE